MADELSSNWFSLCASHRTRFAVHSGTLQSPCTMRPIGAIGPMSPIGLIRSAPQRARGLSVQFLLKVSGIPETSFPQTILKQ
jgi:hypothetical protein